MACVLPWLPAERWPVHLISNQLYYSTKCLMLLVFLDDEAPRIAVWVVLQRAAREGGWGLALGCVGPRNREALPLCRSISSNPTTHPVDPYRCSSLAFLVNPFAPILAADQGHAGTGSRSAQVSEQQSCLPFMIKPPPYGILYVSLWEVP